MSIDTLPACAPESEGREAPLADRYETVRALTLGLTGPLSAEDQVVQTMPDVSPTKWHLAHTTWFFEAFVLRPFLPGYLAFDPAYNYLFNSYYEGVGPRHPRPQRGFLTRPSLDEVLAYRSHVDEAMARFLALELDGEPEGLVTLGLHHEQQHQELIVTDIKHVLSCNPLFPAFAPAENSPAAVPPPKQSFVAVSGGLVWIGHDGPGFAFDNEGPIHQAVVPDFKLASRPVTNGEFAEFISDGGYRDPLLWLADGWATVLDRGWSAPLYWHLDEDGRWMRFTLNGLRPLDVNAPVCHVSLYEAAAFAEWAGKRLPSEQEWEVAARDLPIRGHFLHGAPAEPTPARNGNGLQQLYGDVWEWTRSAYSPYPGFRPAAGAVGEYNGKFMCGQMILRGGSCATPGGHIRPTYRNFFPPDARWQFGGIRLAEDS